MRIFAAILAAGKGERYGADKTRLSLGSKPVWQWSFETFRNHPDIERVVLVGSQANLEELSEDGRWAILGGTTRQESTLRALEASAEAGADILLLHDAARPFVTAEVISRVVEGVHRSGAAAPAIPVTDTIKQQIDGHLTTLDRNGLFAMQTPQGSRTDLLTQAYASATGQHTDDLSLIEAIGRTPELVEGDPMNFKITTPEDYDRSRAILGSGEIRTGFGYDVHAFSPDPTRTLWLGGVAFPDHPALDGHSDADALLHAITDALLGAAALGDIGVHFQNTDSRWKNERSIVFLKHAGNLLAEAGWTIVNVDSTVIAESPKVMKRAAEIRQVIAEALAIDIGRVSLKATTNEQMGFVGRKEGIAATAVATVRKR